MLQRVTKCNILAVWSPLALLKIKVPTLLLQQKIYFVIGKCTFKTLMTLDKEETFSSTVTVFLLLCSRWRLYWQWCQNLVQAGRSVSSGTFLLLGDSLGMSLQAQLKVHDITATRCLRCCYCCCWHRSYCKCRSRKVSASEELNSWCSALLPCGGESQLH